MKLICCSTTPQVLLDKIEQVIRLIRSKGRRVVRLAKPVGYSGQRARSVGEPRAARPARAFTPKDQKAVKTAAQTMRANPAFDTEKPFRNWEPAKALVSFLDAKRQPVGG